MSDPVIAPDAAPLLDMCRRALETLANSECYGAGRFFASYADVASFARHTLNALPAAPGVLAPPPGQE